MRYPAAGGGPVPFRPPPGMCELCYLLAGLPRAPARRRGMPAAGLLSTVRDRFSARPFPRAHLFAKANDAAAIALARAPALRFPASVAAQGFSPALLACFKGAFSGGDRPGNNPTNPWNTLLLDLRRRKPDHPPAFFAAICYVARYALLSPKSARWSFSR